MSETTALVRMGDHIRWVSIPRWRLRTIGAYYEMQQNMLLMLPQIPIVRWLENSIWRLGEELARNEQET